MIGEASFFAEKYSTVCVSDYIRPTKLNTEYIDFPMQYGTQKKIPYLKSAISSIVERFYVQSGSAENFPSILFFCTTKLATVAFSKWFNETFALWGLKSMTHNAGMVFKSRYESEQFFKAHKVHAVFCTTTLAMGMDTPCDVVVILDICFWNWLKKENKRYTASQLIQIAGRAGRGNGILSEGYCFVVCEDVNLEFVKSAMSTPLRVTSAIPTHIDFTLLSWIVAGVSKKANLLEMYQNIMSESSVDINEFNESYSMLQSVFLNADGSANDLGIKTMKFMIEPRTALHVIRLKKILQSVKAIDDPHLFAILVACPEVMGQVSVSEYNDHDMMAIENASKFISLTTIEEIVGKCDFYDEIGDYFGAISKVFAMTYNEYLGKEFGCEQVPATNNDLNTLCGAAKRIASAAKLILGKDWNYGSRLFALVKGIENKVKIEGEKIKKRYPIFSK